MTTKQIDKRPENYHLFLTELIRSVLNELGVKSNRLEVILQQHYTSIYKANGEDVKHNKQNSILTSLRNSTVSFRVAWIILQALKLRRVDIRIKVTTRSGSTACVEKSIDYLPLEDEQ